MPDPEDPMYAYTQGKPKALLDFGGRTMLERVIDGLQGSQSIEDVVVVGLGSDLGMTFQRPVHHLPDQGSLVANALAGVAWLREQKQDTGVVMVCSADIPMITPAMVDDAVALCQPLNAMYYYTYITRQTMEDRFPNSKRTFVKLKGVEIAGGDFRIAACFYH
ncbi:MAG: nucleotidyltransferase family protein [Chloroflexi bacterium]|nr:nucleotidyltransferase family protein [Chloroflexota bacterium]